MIESKIVIVYLVGGSGSRLWPLSRQKQPKPFVNFLNTPSLFLQTINRHKNITTQQIVVTNETQVDLVKQTLKSTNSTIQTTLISEPIPRNTSAAIALAALYLNPEDIMVVVPSDHIIETEPYLDSLSIAIETALKGQLALFGIIPTSPETGYGYIQTKESTQKLKNTPTPILKFHEKPSKDQAATYLSSGNYLWNSGIFCFQVATMLKELQTHCPIIYETSSDALKKAKKDERVLQINKKDMMHIPEMPIDISIMEKSSNTTVIPVEWNWSDLGSFDSILEHFDKDDQGNLASANSIQKESQNNLILSTSKRLICTTGLQDTIVVDTPDALLVSSKNQSSQLKQLLKEVEKETPNLLIEHQTTERPWGYFTVLHESEGYKVKEIGVTPNQRLSLQKHKHRSEHWTIVKGTAIVTIDDQTHTLDENKSIYIPKGAIHRLENKTKNLIKVIEVQYGDYLGEDDIIRIEDDYQRLG
ncbi:mannose-1-phosphate guanylyltransferase/mannose-6-phosphate isomerase [Candidatus Marinamargulisbacteria bacterium SCGC AG-439-L15]|nr:mannose-1-phosphate guanylyltransferase/mannose-6-phosphate isomerase [Candidatus Marinamargulisbacteria bacterium SCGC AG-439-L15]